MSDIFKKIRNIEAEDDAIADALNLDSPRESSAESKNKSAINQNQTAQKPLNLSIPDDDGVLDLDELSLEIPSEAEFLSLSQSELNPQLENRSASASRLGLKPILPIASSASDSRSADHVKTAVPKPEAPPRPAQPTMTRPLPDFMDNQARREPEPEGLKRPPEPSARKEPIEVKFLEHSKDSKPYGDISEFEAPNPMGRLILIAGIFTGFVWVLCVGILLSEMLSNTGAWASMTALHKLGFGVMALLPLTLIGLVTYAFRHLNSLNEASGVLKVTAEALMTPDDTVIARSTIMAKSIQAQVDEVNLKVSSALTRMELLDDMVKSQGSSLAKSSIAIETTTSQIEDRIGAQRQGLEDIATLFEGRMDTLSHMMEGHTSQLASSGQMAEQRVQEARVSVESAAERIASASETVRQNAVAAAQTLSGSQIEITKLGDDVQSQSTRLDAVYRQHLSDLKIMLAELRDQQDELGATMEERLSKMRDMSLSAKVGAQSLTEASIKGRETVEALNAAATLTDTAVRARFSEMEEMVKYSTARAESITETATRQVQNSLSTTRKEIARIEADMMDLMDKLSQAEKSKVTLVPPTPDTQPALRREQFSQPPVSDYERKASTTSEMVKAAPEASNQSLFTLPPATEDKAPPHPDTHLDIVAPEEDDLPAVLRRPLGEQQTKGAAKWSLKGLLGREDTKTPPAAHKVSDADIIHSLTALGLTPAAIVDDGCIIEASNLRKTKGAAAMSTAIAKRLSEPVRHLFMAIETNANLKMDIQTFAAQFDARLDPLENDREAIRTRLESDAGRAYLLCDAALNA